MNALSLRERNCCSLRALATASFISIARGWCPLAPPFTPCRSILLTEQQTSRLQGRLRTTRKNTRRPRPSACSPVASNVYVASSASSPPSLSSTTILQATTGSLVHLDKAPLGPSFTYKLIKAAQCLSLTRSRALVDATPAPAMSLQPPESLARNIAHHRRAPLIHWPVQAFSAC